MEVQYIFKKSLRRDYLLDNFEGLIFPKINVKNKERLPKLLSGVLALQDKQPVGLILTVHFPKINTYRIISLAVAPKFRKQGIGRAMVEKLEGSLKNDSKTKLVTFYRSHWKTATIVQKIFKRRAWETPMVDIRILTGEIQKLAPIYENFENVPLRNFTFINWEKLSEGQYKEIQELIKTEVVGNSLNPFFSQHNIQAKVSQVLLSKNRVVGWFVANQISEKTLEYSSVYVVNGHRSFKTSLVLMKTVIMNHYHYKKESDFLIMVRNENETMTRFTELLSKKSGIPIKFAMKTSKILMMETMIYCLVIGSIG